MRCSRRAALAAAAALLGFAVPPGIMSVQAMAIATPLCGGGVMVLMLGGKRWPVERPGTCHSACMKRRIDDDGDRAEGCASLR